jgi:hypothetical protein
MITNSRMSANLEARDGSTVTLFETFSDAFGASIYPLATMPIKATITPLQSFTTSLCAVNQGRLFILKTDKPVYITYVGNPPEVTTTMLLDVAVNETDVSFSFLSTASFPYSGVGVIGNEIFTWASKTATTLDGVVRGAYGTTPTSHASGDTVTNLPQTRIYVTHGILVSTYISHVIVESSTSGISPTDDTNIEMACVGV